MKTESRWTKEDFSPQKGVGAVFKGEGNKILLQKHKKLEKWSLPGGKGTPREGAYDILVREVQEECGVTITAATLLSNKMVEVFRDEVKMAVPLYVFQVDSYTGTIQNLEPDKHPVQEFLDPQELIARGEPVTHSVQLYLDSLK